MCEYLIKISLDNAKLLKQYIKNSYKEIENINYIETDKIIFNKELRTFCVENKCKMYNKNYGCPPFVGSVDEVVNKVKSYNYILMYYFRYEIKDEEYLYYRKKANKIALEINKFLRQKNINSYHIGSGYCISCENCIIDSNNGFCNKEDYMPSLSSFVMDLNDLTKKLDLDYGFKENEVKFYYAILL